MIGWLKNKWCDLFHLGQVKRDPQGCINWQCDKCGRWGTPVDKRTEARIVESHIRARGEK